MTRPNHRPIRISSDTAVRFVCLARFPVPQRPVGSVLGGLVELYTVWQEVEPDRGYDAKAAKWRAKFEQWQATTRPATTQPADQ